MLIKIVALSALIGFIIMIVRAVRNPGDGTKYYSNPSNYDTNYERLHERAEDNDVTKYDDN